MINVNLFEILSIIVGVKLLNELWIHIKVYLTDKWNTREENHSKSLVFQWKNYGKVHGALFFPDNTMLCPYLAVDQIISDKRNNSYCRSPVCKFQHQILPRLSMDISKSAFKQFISLLHSATKSLDVCVWVFSMPTLANVCLYLHNEKNVLVRVIIGARDSVTDGNQIPRLRKAGIQIRYCLTPSSQGYMHNKFAIVDQGFVMTGSLNWTRSAFYNNHENVIVTSEPDIVKDYTKYFQEMWSKSTNESKI